VTALGEKMAEIRAKKAVLYSIPFPINLRKAFFQPNFFGDF